MHNGQLADPLNRFAREMKKISGKRNKTEADYEELARLEFLGGLYVNDGGPCVPGELVEAALVEAAKKMRRGNQAKAGIIVDGTFALEYDGPRDPQQLWETPAFRLVAGVKIQRNRIMRTRPIFHEWACEVAIDFLPGQLNRSEVEELAATAGSIVGIGDWRPKFGRFTASAL